MGHRCNGITEMRLRLQSNPYKLGVFFLIIGHLVSNIVWLSQNNAPQTWDSAGHLVLSYIFSSYIKNHLEFLSFIQISPYYPPLIHLLGGIILSIFGNNYHLLLFTGTIFFIIAIVYLFFFIADLNRDNYRVAFLGVLMFSLFPQVWEQSRLFHLDLPLTAMVIASVFHLFRSDGLKNHFHSIMFFIFLSFAQLTKWYGFIFLLVPIFYYFKFNAQLKISFYLIYNSFLGFSIFLLFVSPWYLVNCQNILSVSKITLTGEIGDPSNLFTSENIFHYLELISSYQLTFLSMLVIWISATFLIIKKKKQVFVLLFAILFPYGVFTFIPNKDLRYLLPLAPIFVILITVAVDLERKFLSLVMGITSILGCVFLYLSFGPSTGVFKSNLLSMLIGGPYWSNWYSQDNHYRYDVEDWSIPMVFDDLEAIISGDENSIGIYNLLDLVEERHFSVAAFELERYQQKIENLFVFSPQYQLTPYTIKQLDELLTSIDFVVLADTPGPEGLRNFQTLVQLSTEVQNRDSDFIQIKMYPLPNGNNVRLYVRKGLVLSLAYRK